MEPSGRNVVIAKPRRSFGEVLKSYFYWTYPRGSFHYDVKVTLILLFIFITPQLWNYGDKPIPATTLEHPIQVSGDGGRGMVIVVAASDVKLPAHATDMETKYALRQAILPVTGDAVFVERWETLTDAQGNLEWKVWAHR
jgi:hypothetical protein